MSPRKLAAALALAGVTAPAAAQDIQEDVRCVILSGMFVKSAPDDKGKQIARLTGSFYLGRIDRADAKAVTEALRTESKAIDIKAAGLAMDACAAKLGRAQAAMNALGRSVGTEK